MNFERLKQAGFDVEGAVTRFSGNQALYLRFIKKFPQDESFQQIRPALTDGDFKKALGAAHTLKGVTGNLGMTYLHQLCTELVTALREGKFDEVNDLFNATEQWYHKVCDTIASLSGPST